MGIYKLSTDNSEVIKQSRIVSDRRVIKQNIDRESNDRDGIELSKENVSDIVDTLNFAAKSVKKKVSFSYHEKTNRVIMKVHNASTNEVIREIPTKEMIQLLEHIHEMIGMFVDESR